MNEVGLGFWAILGSSMLLQPTLERSSKLPQDWPVALVGWLDGWLTGGGGQLTG